MDQLAQSTAKIDPRRGREAETDLYNLYQLIRFRTEDFARLYPKDSRRWDAEVLRLRVVELTGAPMTVMRCLRRYGGYAAGMATGGVGFAQMLWDPNRQAVQDRTAHTAVIDLRTPRLQEAGPGEP